MPAPVSTALLVFGAVLTSVSAEAGVIVAAFGVAIETLLFFLAGRDGLG